MNTKYAVTTTYYSNSNVELFDTIEEAIKYANGKACGLDSHSTITLEKYELEEEEEIVTNNIRINSNKPRNAWHNFLINVGKVGCVDEDDEFTEIEPTESQEICGYECNLIYVVGDDWFIQYELEEAKKYAKEKNLKIIEKYSDGDDWYDTEEELHVANDCSNYLTF